MDFENQTPFPADIWRTQLFYKDLLMAIILLKLTFQVSNKGNVSLDKDKQIPLQEGPQETPFGTLDSDYAPIKENVDLIILGNAYAPNGKPVIEMEIGVQIGDFSNTLVVLGNRFWTKKGLFTPPEPFSIMPITYANSYGGTSKEYNEIHGMFAPNPIGKGYVVKEDELEGTPLPNIEDPLERIKSWKDRPTPAGFAPLPVFSSLRGLRGVQVDLDKKMTTLEPLYFNTAHPKMMLSGFPIGSKCTLTGMTQEGVWEFDIPEYYFGIDVHLGDSSFEFLMEPDTLCLLPEEKKFFIIYRRTIIYPFIPEQQRSIFINSLEKTKASEIKSHTHRSLMEAASDPSSSIKLEPLMKNTQVLPFSYEKMMEYYPLTKIILSLPVCEG